MLVVWVKWFIYFSVLEFVGYKRQFGFVCYQDFRVCDEFFFEDFYEWLEDIIKWLICIKNSVGNYINYFYMDCVIIGWFCCIGIKGRCEIIFWEYCDFMRGYFYEEVMFCFQVYCMDDVCGFLFFFNFEVFDQFYCLWLFFFLYVGILYCLVFICFQMIVLWDLEKLVGWYCIVIIYLLSGVIGNLVSVIFLLY